MKFIQIFLLISCIATSQTYTIIYNEKSLVDPKNFDGLPENIKERKIKESQKSTPFELLISNGISRYQLLDPKDLDPAEYPNINFSSTVNPLNNIFYNDFNENQFFAKKLLGLDTYFIQDSILKMDWKLTEEKQMILNYTCQKATTVWHGYEFTAWFTPEIPIATGPEKYVGLPGLILKAETMAREYTAIDIKIKDENTFIAKPFENKSTITFDKFRVLTEEKIQSLQSQNILPNKNQGVILLNKE